jgi:hypothetical protein
MNEGYTHVEGKVYQKVSVLILSTEKRSDFVLHTKSNLLEYVRDQRAIIGTTEYFQTQHLYFLSSEEIKEGDWAINLYSNSLFKITQVFTDGYEGYKPGNEDIVYGLTDGMGLTNFKKVIATTDPALNIRDLSEEEKRRYSPALKSVDVPRPSNSFLEAYVREYNKGAAITEVLVEMEKGRYYESPESSGESYGGLTKDKLKVAPDNTITVKPVVQKQTYTRNEVIGLLIDYRNSIMPVGEKEIAYLNQFVNDNLK